MHLQIKLSAIVPLFHLFLR